MPPRVPPKKSLAASDMAQPPPFACPAWCPVGVSGSSSQEDPRWAVARAVSPTFLGDQTNVLKTEFFHLIIYGGTKASQLEKDKSPTVLIPVISTSGGKIRTSEFPHSELPTSTNHELVPLRTAAVHLNSKHINLVGG